MSSKNLCEKCGGRGFTVVSERPIDCECLRERRRQSVYDAIGIPRHLRSLSINEFRAKQDAAGTDNMADAVRQKHIARSLVIQYCDQIADCLRTGGPFILDPARAFEKAGVVGEVSPHVWKGRWLVLSGPRSSGKSMLSAIIAMAAAEVGAYPRILQWANIIESCYDFDRSGGGLFGVMTTIFGRCMPLIIENVDAAYEFRGESGTGSSMSPTTKLRLDILFGPIYDDSIPVIFTTTRGPDQIQTASKALGPVLGSILEGSGVVELPGLANTHEMTVIGRGV